MRITIAAVLLALALPLAAQTSTANCQDASTFEQTHEKRGGVLGGAQKVMSMPSTTVNAPPDANVCPLTAHQKLDIFLQRSYRPANLLAAAASAGIWQATDTDRRGWGQGGEAYGKRFGASMAEIEATEFFGSFMLASILKQDPRYFRKGQGSFGDRFGYSISRILVTRTDSGKQTFNFSNVGGALGAAALSNAYRPAVDQNGGRTAMSFGLSMASAAGFNFLSEFGPDIWHKVRGKNKN